MYIDLPPFTWSCTVSYTPVITFEPAPRTMTCGHGSIFSFFVVTVVVVAVAVVVDVVGGKHVIVTFAVFWCPAALAPLMETNIDSP